MPERNKLEFPYRVINAVFENYQEGKPFDTTQIAEIAGRPRSPSVVLWKMHCIVHLGSRETNKPGGKAMLWKLGRTPGYTGEENQDTTNVVPKVCRLCPYQPKCPASESAMRERNYELGFERRPGSL